MSFTVGMNDVLSAMVGIVASLLTYLGVRATVGAKKEADLPAGWQSLTAEMKAYFREQLKDRDERLEDLSHENEELRRRVEENTDLRRRVEQLEKRDAQRDAYLEWVDQRDTAIEVWAAENDIQLPPPPRMTFEEWRRHQYAPSIRHPPP